MKYIKIIDNAKECSKCKTFKPLDCFSRDKYRETGYKSACKECAKSSYTKWRTKNLESARKKDRIYHYMRKYDLSLEESMKLVENRNGKCSICGGLKKLIIDHCHNTGTVRGKICSHCNSMLGYSGDNIEVLYNAIKYLEASHDIKIRTKRLF